MESSADFCPLTFQFGLSQPALPTLSNSSKEFFPIEFYSNWFSVFEVNQVQILALSMITWVTLERFFLFFQSLSFLTCKMLIIIVSLFYELLYAKYLQSAWDRINSVNRYLLLSHGEENRIAH